MSVEFLRPWILLLVLLLPGLVVALRQVRTLGARRKRAVLFLRIAAFLLLVGALAETQLLSRGDVLCVMFVVDRSASIPEEEHQFAQAYLESQARQMTRKDRAGLVFFARQAAIESPPVRKLYMENFHTVVDSEGTDLARAIRLALAAFPEDCQKRIVLITDGNQTQGDVEAEVRRARANGVEVSVLPLRYEYNKETSIEEVVIPAHVRQEEPFNVTIIINAQTSGPATVRLFRQGQLVAEQEVQLDAGKNAFIVPQVLEGTGFYRYEALIEPQMDTRGTNNRAESFVNIAGVGRILYLEGQPSEGVYLAAALESEGISVHMAHASQAPSSLEEYAAYDLIILSDLSAGDISPDQQRMIQSAVREFGSGLLMIGGENSFGIGGYLNTPIEEALPVTMDIKQRAVLPSGALVMIMHTAELPQANYWAQVISLISVDRLSSEDYMGFLRYSNREGESWLFPLEKLGNKIRQRFILRNLRAEDIGDMPDFNKTLEMAYDALTQCRANYKHIVIMSDGDPTPPSQSLIEMIRQANITISTVCFNAHNQPAPVMTMRQVAASGGGNAYLVEDNTQLPSIFIKEAMRIRRSLIVEEPFTPAVVDPSEVLDGLDESFPILLGYVVTSIRPDAQLVLVSDKKDPLLALRRYGLGKTAAFTSDAKRRWAAEWLSWEKYAKFWAQLVRWTMRSPGEEFLQVESRVDGQWAYVAIDAIDPNGRFLNGLDITATAVDTQIQPHEFTVRQTAPGRYEGRFHVERAGTHLVSLSVEAEGVQSHISTGVSMPYSPEQRSIRSNEGLQRRVAQLGGGRMLDAEMSAFTHDLVAHTRQVALWPHLLGLAMFLFFLDICFRRLFVEFRQVSIAVHRVAEWVLLPLRRVAVPTAPAPTEMGQLMQAKSRAEAMRGTPAHAQAPRRSMREPAAVERDSARKDQLLSALDEVDLPQSLPARPRSQPKHPVPVADEEMEVPGEYRPATRYTGSLLEAKRRAQARLRETKPHQPKE